MMTQFEAMGLCNKHTQTILYVNIYIYIYIQLLSDLYSVNIIININIYIYIYVYKCKQALAGRDNLYYIIFYFIDIEFYQLQMQLLFLYTPTQFIIYFSSLQL